MDDWLGFILERYNYWIFIVLMMTGLYIVFARGNLVKKLVGLNIFQTSVFIYYISIGKVAGGTAPIYMGGELEAVESHHGGEENSAVSAEHASAETLHSKIDNNALEQTNDLKEMLKHAPPQSDDVVASVHDLPDAGDKISNNMLAHAGKTPTSPGLEIAPDISVNVGHDATGDAAHSVADAASGLMHGGAVEAIVYTNPLPHVLILTAIVVGVATTAVGLALAVRIREAYGTIEEDELEAANDIAEFGVPGGAAA